MKISKRVLRASFHVGLISWGLLLIITIIPPIVRQLKVLISLAGVGEPLRDLSLALGLIGLVSFIVFFLGKLKEENTNRKVALSTKGDEFISAAEEILRETPHNGKLFVARLENYRHWSSVLAFLVVSLGTVSVASALVAAAFTDVLKDSVWLKIATLTSALSATLLTSLNLQNRASSVWSAYRHLESAILLYGDEQDLSKLISAYKESEDKVGFVQFKSNQ